MGCAAAQPMDESRGIMMEDLVPLILFLLIVAVNVLKFLIERSGKKPATEKPQRPEEAPPRSRSPHRPKWNLFEHVFRRADCAGANWDAGISNRSNKRLKLKQRKKLN